MLDKQTLIDKHLSNLVYLAKIDDHFDQSEKDLVYKIGFKSGLNAKQIDQLIDRAEDIDIVVPDNEEDQFEYLFNVVQMMMIDGKLYQKELDYCVEVAIRLGFKKIIVTVLIRAIEDGLKLGLDVDSIKREAFDLIAE
ncbi:MAG: hypothetical protein RH860_12695 [Cytophagales bacterium]